MVEHLLLQYNVLSLETYNPSSNEFDHLLDTYQICSDQITPLLYLDQEQLAVAIFEILCKEFNRKIEPKTISAEPFLSLAAELKRNMIPGGKKRSDLYIGETVDIVLKYNQGSKILTRGTIKDILSPSLEHPRGLKVRLDLKTEDLHRVGRVKFIEKKVGSEFE